METNYLDRQTRSPGAIAAVVAIHAAGIGALILFSPTVTKTIETILVARPIPLEKDPPEIVNTIEPKIKTAAEHPVDHVKPLVGGAPAEGEKLYTDPGPLTGVGIGDGLGEVITPPIDPPNVPVIVIPRIIPRDVQPPYPPGMQRLGIEGSVTVRVLVGIEGCPLRVEAVRVDQDAFLTATRDWAMKHWKFSPATRDGEPYEEWRTMTVRFTMDGIEP